VAAPGRVGKRQGTGLASVRGQGGGMVAARGKRARPWALWRRDGSSGIREKSRPARSPRGDRGLARPGRARLIGKGRALWVRVMRTAGVLGKERQLGATLLRVHR
jgi:hypothetical protein